MTTEKATAVAQSMTALMTGRSQAAVLAGSIFLIFLGGFYAIVMAMNGKFDQASIGIFCAILCSFTYVVAQIYGVGLITTRLSG